MRIAIVNDIVMAAEVLKRLVTSVPEYEIAWIAYDGAEAIEKCKADTPDLILMDLVMPYVDGPTATRQIMEHAPCAILIVTASVSGNVNQVFEAMGYGALDVTAMPILGNNPNSEGAQKLLDKIKLMHRLIGKEAEKGASEALNTLHALSRGPKNSPPLVVLGASTGGPLALNTILSQIPSDSPAAFAVVQHVDGPFAENLVSWLGGQCPLPVEIAKVGSVPRAGVVLVAGTSNHMTITKDLRIHYTVHPENSIYKPSIDVFFQSVAQNWPTPGTGVLLTGMGKDGAKGLKALHDKGWHTIAQDKESSVVYGMPKAAVDLGATSTVLPLKKISESIKLQTQQEQIAPGVSK